MSPVKEAITRVRKVTSSYSKLIEARNGNMSKVPVTSIIAIAMPVTAHSNRCLAVTSSSLLGLFHGLARISSTCRTLCASNLSLNCFRITLLARIRTFSRNLFSHSMWCSSREKPDMNIYSCPETSLLTNPMCLLRCWILPEEKKLFKAEILASTIY